MKRGGNICSWLSALAAAGIAVGCAAPRNYYVETAYMMRLGEEAREASGRPLNEPLVPESAKRPVVTPIGVRGVQETTFVALAEKRPVPAPSAPKPVLDPVEIALDRERLVTLLRREQRIGAVSATPINGRLTGDRNLIRIEFIPSSRDELTILREYLLICATVVGMDSGRTVDAVVGLATDAQLNPALSVKGDLNAFAAYRAGELTLEQFRERIDVQRY